MLEYQNIKAIFAKRYTPNWSEEVFENTVLWTYIISDLNSEETVGTCYEKELQKTNQIELRVGKVIKRKGDKVYVKWKDFDNSFNSWIEKIDIVWTSDYFPKPKNLWENVKVSTRFV